MGNTSKNSFQRNFEFPEFDGTVAHCRDWGQQARAKRAGHSGIVRETDGASRLPAMRGQAFISMKDIDPEVPRAKSKLGFEWFIKTLGDLYSWQSESYLRRFRAISRSM